MNIPHSKPWIIDKDLEAVNVTISTGMIAQGSKVSEFEEQISLYTTLPYCVATSSGTAALVLALLALEIRLKDEVILPTYVCPQVLETNFPPLKDYLKKQSQFQYIQHSIMVK